MAPAARRNCIANEQIFISISLITPPRRAAFTTSLIPPKKFRLKLRRIHVLCRPVHDRCGAEKRGTLHEVALNCHLVNALDTSIHTIIDNDIERNFQSKMRRSAYGKVASTRDCF